jgi:S-adenosylmethionine:tRNA ribosyltransferase-isomerase
MRPATHPVIASRDARLLVVGRTGVSHLARAGFPLLLRPHDLVVANDAATLPASLTGTHRPTGGTIEVRLAGKRSLDPADATRFFAVVFGAGDYRTATEDRPLPPALAIGDELLFADRRDVGLGSGGPDNVRPAARVVEILGHPRLVELQFRGTAEAVWSALATHGRPVQYSYVPEPLAIWDTWTRVAAKPVAFEAPSAGFLLDWSMLRAIRARGAQFGTLTHAAGLSSTGDPGLDRRLPLDEPYEIPASTAALIASSRAAGGRIIAVGTTVVRSLESASDGDGRVRAGAGLARVRLGPASRLTVVDGIVSGMHEAGTSHYQLLEAFAAGRVLEEMNAAAEAGGYRAHEFGDFVFVEREYRHERGCRLPAQAA